MTNLEESNIRKTEILKERKNPFPDDLEGRLNGITNVVNNELKALAFLHLDDGYAGISEMKSRLKNTVGSGIYLPHSGVFGSYCSMSLFPIGAVAEGKIKISNSSGPKLSTCYRLTKAGKKYGRPIAAFTLDYVSRTGKSMFEILGSTHTSGKTRNPLNKIKILEYLENKGELKLSDLTELLQTNNNNFVLNNLKPLSKIGFIDYNSIGDVEGDSFIVYEWIKGKNSEEVKPWNHYVSLTKEIAETLSVMGNLNTKQVKILVGAHKVSHILPHLVREGFARRVSEFTNEKKSKIRLLESGKQFLNEWLEPVKDALQNGESLSEMQKLYESLINDDQRFADVSRTGIELYTEISPGINKRSREETNREIIKYLIDHPGRRPKEISEELSLSNSNIIYHSITPLIKSGILTKKKEGRKTKYFVDEKKAREAGLLV